MLSHIHLGNVNLLSITIFHDANALTNKNQDSYSYRINDQLIELMMVIPGMMKCL